MDSTIQPGAVSGATQRRVSFLHWSAPVLAGWALVCVLAAAAYNFSDPGMLAVAYLSPVYAALYLARVNALFLQKPLSEKLFTAALLVILSIPAAYLITDQFAQNITGPTYSRPGYFMRSHPPPGELADILDFLIRVLVVLIVFSVLMPLMEKVILGTSAGFRHAIGAFGSVLLSLVILADLLIVFFWMIATILDASGFISMRDLFNILSVQDVSDFVSLFFLIIVPIPHLFAVWRGWPWVSESQKSALTGRRASCCVIVVAVLVYGHGILRAMPNHGRASVLWPQFIHDDEVWMDAHLARFYTLRYPMGRGAMPVGGNVYLIPADYSDFSYDLESIWSDSIRGYQYIKTRATYSAWIDGYNLADWADEDDIESLEYADIRIAPRSRTRQQEYEFLCAPDSVYDLRPCFHERQNVDLLSALGFDRNDLEPIRLGRPVSAPSDRQVLLVDDRLLMDPTGAASPVTTIGGAEFVALCERPDGGNEEPASHLSDVRWLGMCRLELDDGGATAELELDARLLPYWAQVLDGFRNDLDAWQSAAEGVDRIDTVADWIADEWVTHLDIQFSPECLPDRLLVSALGVDWRVYQGFGSRWNSHCRQLRMGMGLNPGWTPE